MLDGAAMRAPRCSSLFVVTVALALSACADNDRLSPAERSQPSGAGGSDSAGGAGTGGAETGGTESSGGASTGGTAAGGASTGGAPSTGGRADPIDGGEGDGGSTRPSVAFGEGSLTTWEGTGKLRIPFTLSSQTDRDLVIALARGGATDASDVTIAGDSVTVAAGATAGFVELTVLDDDVPEHDETLVIRLVPGDAVVGDVPTATITIEDDDLRSWQGVDAVTVADDAQAFGTNLSDLAYRRDANGAVLWAIQNGPSRLFRLLERGNGTFASDSTQGWSSGKALRWPGAEKGSPDTEGLTFAEATSPALYAATERDNGTPNDNRFSILRFDPAAPGSELTATHEWNVTADIPAVSGPNLGLEALAWIPDTYLVERAFYDEGRSKTYVPAEYPDHGEGVFVVGVEATGMLYVYVLEASGGAHHRLAEIPSGFVSQLGGSTVVGLAFDREQSVLWATCDNNCDNRAHVLKIETNPLSTAFGRFQVRRRFERPQAMPATLNNEGIAFAPLSECQAGVRSFFWTDDSSTDGHSLRRGTLLCGPAF